MGPPIKVAYADPPHLGMAEKFYGHLHPDAAAYDRPETHRALFERLSTEFDGWAYSLTSTTLRALLPLAPEGVRVAAWVKPFASFKPNVNPAYAWEPVIFKPARKPAGNTVRDYCAVNIALRRGFQGAKPEEFCRWVFDLIGAQPTDEFVDVFPGSGAVQRAWDSWRSMLIPPPAVAVQEAML